MQRHLTDSTARSLVDACRRGDATAFSELFIRYYDQVHSLATSFTGDPGLAADITQEVFLKLLNRVEQLRSDGDFKSWLYRIVANTCIDNHRRSRRFVSLAEVEDERALVQPARQEQDACQRQRRVQLGAAVAELPPRLRLPLVLRYVSGLSYEEIGRVLDIPSGTVASRLCRAQRQLERSLAHLRGVGREDRC